MKTEWQSLPIGDPIVQAYLQRMVGDRASIQMAYRGIPQPGARKQLLPFRDRTGIVYVKPRGERRNLVTGRVKFLDGAAVEFLFLIN